jgi:hypothetical protein
MMIDRRTFIQSAGAVVATSAATVLLPRPSRGQSQNSLPVGPGPAMVADETNGDLVVFKIDGWDRCDDHTALAGSSSNVVTTISSCNQVGIKINQSWRTAWR